MAIRKGPKPEDKAGAGGIGIQEAAYYRWLERGRPDGTALDDWLHAEAEAGIAGAKKKPPAAPRKRAAKAPATVKRILRA